MRGSRVATMIAALSQLAAPVQKPRWFGYVFGLIAVMVMTALLAVLVPGRLANASALYTIPVLLTAARYGRTPALTTSIAAFIAFDWFFAGPPPLDASHVPTLLVLLLISLVAGQLATTLHHQAEAARQREREALAMYEMAKLVPGSTLELEPVLGLILDQLKAGVDYDSAAVVLRDDGDAAVIVEYRGPLPRARVVGYQLQPGKSIGELMATVSRRSEPLIVEHVSPDAWDIADGSLPKVASQDRTLLAVPLIVKGHVIGMQVLLRDAVHSYSSRHAELAMIFAQQAAVAIENARLYEETRDKAALQERQRLARELHDSVSQSLYGIALNASAAQELFDVSAEETRILLGDVLHLAEAGLTEMRALIFELRPESLEQEGLVGALEKHAAAVEARHGLKVRLSVAAEPRLPARTKEALYRVAQEALHNAAKHARARCLEVALDAANGEVRLVVADDGRGFDPQQEFPGHLGLRSMRERAVAVGGTLEIVSAPDVGTRLTARVPLAVPGVGAPQARSKG